MQSCGTCAWVSLGYVTMRLPVLSVTSRCQSNLSNSNAFCLSGPPKNTRCICGNTDSNLANFNKTLSFSCQKRRITPTKHTYQMFTHDVFEFLKYKCWINSTSHEACFHWYCLSHLHLNLSIESLFPDQWLCGWCWRTNTAHSKTALPTSYLASFDSSVFS